MIHDEYLSLRLPRIGAAATGDSYVPAAAGEGLLPQSRRLLEALRPGIVVGRYRLGERIGLGGMGVVHRAEALDLGRAVAMKFLISGDEQRNREALERFAREAAILRGLSHPAIVQVHGMEARDGFDFLVMDLYLGPRQRPVNLGDYSRHFGPGTGQLEEDDLRHIFRVLLGALAHAHGQGVVHCDLKPANILFECLRSTATYWDAHLKLTDFGLAKIVGEGRVHSSVHESLHRLGSGQPPSEDISALVGTYEYMSPEQRRGQPATAASDLYAVGLMMFRLLTGRQEPGFRLPSQLRRGIAPAWDPIIATALRDAPAQRFPDAAAMQAAVAAVVPATGRPAAAAPSPQEGQA